MRKYSTRNFVGENTLNLQHPVDTMSLDTNTFRLLLLLVFTIAASGGMILRGYLSLAQMRKATEQKHDSNSIDAAIQ